MAVQPPWLLIIDATYSHWLARELSDRGYEAKSCEKLGYKGWKDPPLLNDLAKRYVGVPFVLVTTDDKMPLDHGDQIAGLGLTIATVRPAPKGVRGKAENSWRIDSVHRWAHKIATQPLGTIRRYWPSNHGLWRPPAR